MTREAPRLALSAALLCTLVACSGAAAPSEVTDEKDRRIVEAFLGHTEKMPENFSVEQCRKQAADQPEAYTWIVLPQVGMSLTAYEMTGDAKYLDMFTAVFANMRQAMTEGPDGYLGWYGKPLGTFAHPGRPDQKVDVIITSYRTIDTLCRFIELTDTDGELKEKYAEKRTQYLKLIEHHLAKKWIARGCYVELGTLGAVFRTHPALAETKAHLTQPHNKHAIIVHALLRLYRVTNNSAYMQTAVKLGTRFKRCLRLRNGHYEWNYWDPAGAWDVHPSKPAEWKHWMNVEHKGGYYSSSLSQAVDLYHHGLVFDKVDIERFVKTQVGVAWNGDLENPKWARCDGTTSEKYMKGEYMCAALAPFHKKVYQFVYTGARQDERVADARHPWRGGPYASGWLHGKYVHCPAATGGTQIHLDAGRSFVKNRRNARAVQALNFTVTGGGYEPPNRPELMKPMPRGPRRR